MGFKIVRNDITRMQCDAIVNPANEFPKYGSGCDYAIYHAAGKEKLLELRQEIGRVEEGGVFITPGFNLPAKYIIHAVSPRYIDGNHGEEEKLRSCFRNSLYLAAKYKIRSIAFPLIGAGGFRNPREVCMRIAADEFNAFLLTHEMDITLVVFGQGSLDLGRHLRPDLEDYIDSHYVEQKYMEEYGRPYSGGWNLNDEEEIQFRKRREHPSFHMTTPAPGKAAPKFPWRERELTFGREDFEEEYFAEEDNRLDLETRPESAILSSQAGINFDEEEERLEKLRKQIDERMRHRADTFSQYLMYLIQQKGLSNADVYKRAIVDKKVFSKIKNNPDYHPQKTTALCLCIGAKLNLDEARDLLSRAGYALSPCDKRDIIFSYFLERGIYDIIELDIQLEEHGLDCLIA